MDAIERRKRAGAEAAAWWVLLEAKDVTRAQREDFIDWLRDSQTNVAEMLRLAQVHGVLGQFRGWADISKYRSGADKANIVALRSPAGGEFPVLVEDRGSGLENSVRRLR